MPDVEDGWWEGPRRRCSDPRGRWPAAAGADGDHDRDRHLERLVRGRRARVRDLVRRGRRDRQSDDRHRRLEGRPGALARPGACPRRRAARRSRSTSPGRRGGDVSVPRALLLPAFEASVAAPGRLSMQTDPTLFRSFDRMLAKGQHFASLAPNIVVKFPATSVGVGSWKRRPTGASASMRPCRSACPRPSPRATVERGLRRREAEGLPVDDMGPVIR